MYALSFHFFCGFAAATNLFSCTTTLRIESITSWIYLKILTGFNLKRCVARPNKDISLNLHFFFGAQSSPISITTHD